MEPLTEENIRKKLSAIEDPDLKQDIVSAGFVKELLIEEGNVALTLELTTPACPFKASFRDQATKLIHTLAGVKNVTVTITSQSKSSSSKLFETSTLKTVTSIIAIASCKGGVGKSTIASLLACELAMRGYRVGLLDADIFGPSLPTLFNIKPHGVKMKDKKLVPLTHALISSEKSQILNHHNEHSAKSSDPNLKQGSDLKVMSFGFLLGDAPAVMRGAMVSNYIRQILHTVAWGDLDYLFIDLPPGTGDTILTLAQSVQIDGAIIVTTPASLSLVDVARGMLMFDKVNVPILGVIENMAYFMCDNCSKKHYVFEKSSHSLEERFGVQTLVQVPLVSGADQFSFAPQYHIASTLKPTIETMIEATVRRIGMVTKEGRYTPDVSYNERNVTLVFPTGEKITLANDYLRFNCPCALCRDETSGVRKITREQIPPNIAATSVKPLGNYALAFTWNDRHSSGIYSYQLLKKLASTEPVLQ
ncbi:hypothetical protein COTS27_00746 [Spirochaetota bacterium]|nr:hypothetical protein COTS27_00746 [Spirochaetota bacterium]